MGVSRALAAFSRGSRRASASAAAARLSARVPGRAPLPGAFAAPAAARAAGEEQLPPGKVTWTSLLDMAASVARVKMMLGVLKDSPILIMRPKSDFKLTPETFAKMLCAFSAGGGHLAVMKWAQALGYPWDEMTYAHAANYAHLEVIQLARAHECP